MKKYILLLITFLPPFLIQAQHKYEAGLLLGGSTYQGDLSVPPLGSLQETNLAYGLMFRTNLDSNFTARASIMQTTLSGNDQNNERLAARNFEFTTNLSTIALLFEWNIFPSLDIQQSFTPYLFAGGALTFIAPEPNFNNASPHTPIDPINEDRQASSSLTKFAIPFGLGIKTQINDQWALGFEAALHPTFTDYLDGISQAANPHKNDWYGTAGISVTYCWGIFDKDKDGVANAVDSCPEQAGLDIHNGCPDSDNDGIPDHLDKCPHEAAPMTKEGCPF